MNRRRVSAARRGLIPLRRFLLSLVFLAVPACGEPLAAEPGARFAAAIAELQSPALTPASTQRARTELAAVVAAAPATSEGVAALYLLGRLSQLEDGIAEPVELARLWREHPDHPLGQLAALKVLLRRLYSDEPESPDDRLRHGEELGAVITLPALRSDYHLAMGEAYLFHGDRRGPALRHLRAAAASGIPSAATRANVLVQIGELARLTGAKDVAAASYRAFIAEFPRDLRQQIVRDRLAEVEGTAP
jgi:hypothetical protein